MIDENDEDEVQNLSIISSMTGCRIISAEYTDPNAANEWSNHGCITFTLDDGRVVTIVPWGYDASGMIVRTEEGND